MTGGSGAVRTGLVRAAVGIAAVTVLARALGFGRIVVFAHSVGTTTCLGTAYYTANTIPNIVFEVVAGGALASAVVPVLAGAVEQGDRATAGRTASALLTWTVLLLLPGSLLAALVARPLLGLFLDPATGPCDGAAVLAVATRMLQVFAPQVVLYGIGVVLAGVLQAHRRFLGPALAPLLSSLVVIGAYLAYGSATAGRPGDLAALRRGPELLLSVGTTLGVVALSLSLLVPLARTGLPLHPTLSFPPGVAARVRRLAAAGAATLAAQQVSVAVVLRLADTAAPKGGIVLYNLAWTMFLVPWAVLAVPIATAAFPQLSGRAAAGDADGFAAVAARSTRAVVLVSLAAAAVLVVAAGPLARVLVLGTRGDPDPAELSRAVVAFAPGLLGYALVAHLGRALYALGQGRAAAVRTVTGWGVVVLADVIFVGAAPAGWTVAALAAGNTVGMTVAGLLLLRATARGGGAAARAGVGRAAAAGLLAAGCAVLAGLLLAGRVAAAGLAGSAAAAACLGLAALAVYAAVLVAADGGDARALLAGLRR